MASTIHEKIAKLLALSTSSNDGESAAAMALAQKLMMQHGIEQDQLNPTEKPRVGETSREPLKADFQGIAGQAAAVLYGCKVVYYQNGKDKEIVFVGRESNREVAKATWSFFLLQIEAQYKVDLPKGLTQKERAAFRLDYKLSMARRMYQRCESYQPSNPGTALVVHKAGLVEEVDDYLGGLGVKVKKAKARTIKSAQALVAGDAAGRRADIERQGGSKGDIAQTRQLR